MKALMDEFVCVRIIQGYGMDLHRFQFDYQLTWGVFFLNADGAIYGRYGSRAANYGGDISIEGFKKALKGALDLHAAYPANKAALAGKTGAPPRWERPETIPTLMHKKAYDTSRGGCIHCHEIHDGQLQSLRKEGATLSDDLLWYYPMPDAVGLEMDVDEMATVKRVAADSAAEKSGFRAGDKILRLDGQPLISIADLQWVLHNAKPPTKLVAEVERGQKTLELTLPLEAGWRREEDFTWRSHIWYLRQGIAGFFVKPLTEAERQELGLTRDTPAFRVAGFPPSWVNARNRAAAEALAEGDVILEVDGLSQPLTTESRFLAYLSQKKPQARTQLTIQRGENRQNVELTLQ
jgi:hypothetical protein